MRITDLAYNDDGSIKNPWRAALQPAQFRDAFFHVEADSIESGRRVVVHEFPKKNVPYSEDMGRRAYEFTVRGYCIQFPYDNPPDGSRGGSQLQRRDYRIARDILVRELTSGEPGILFLPTYGGTQLEITVICPRFRLMEEERVGGYCVFDMTFVELGVAPQEPPPDPRDKLIEQYSALIGRLLSSLANPESRQQPGAGNA